MSSFNSAESASTKDKLSKLRYVHKSLPNIIRVISKVYTEWVDHLLVTSVYIYIYRFELDALQTKVNVERERYQAAAQSQVTVVSAIPKLHINDRLTLSASDASYLLRYKRQCILFHWN